MEPSLVAEGSDCGQLNGSAIKQADAGVWAFGVSSELVDPLLVGTLLRLDETLQLSQGAQTHGELYDSRAAVSLNPPPALTHLGSPPFRFGEEGPAAEFMIVADEEQKSLGHRKVRPSSFELQGAWHARVPASPPLLSAMATFASRDRLLRIHAAHQSLRGRVKYVQV